MGQLQRIFYVRKPIVMPMQTEQVKRAEPAAHGHRSKEKSGGNWQEGADVRHMTRPILTNAEHQPDALKMHSQS